MSNYTTNCIHYQVCRRTNCNTKCQYFEEKLKGEWIVDTNTQTMKFKCCGAVENTDRLLVDNMNFCYNCGAKMKGGADMRGKDE